MARSLCLLIAKDFWRGACDINDMASLCGGVACNACGDWIDIEASDYLSCGRGGRLMFYPRDAATPRVTPDWRELHHRVDVVAIGVVVALGLSS